MPRPVGGQTSVPAPKPNDSQHSIEAEWCIALSFLFNQIMTRIANRSSKDAKNTGSLLRLRYAIFHSDGGSRGYDFNGVLRLRLTFQILTGAPPIHAIGRIW